MTARTEALLADAIRAAALVVLRVRIDEAQATALAKGGSVDRAISALDSRLSIKRAVPGLPLTSEVQKRLAISEVALAMTEPHSSGSDQTVRRLINAEVQAEASANQLRSASRKLDSLMTELETAEPQRRAFYRQVSRLYSDQQSRLRAGIADDQRFAASLARLDAFYIATVAL